MNSTKERRKCRKRVIVSRKNSSSRSSRSISFVNYGSNKHRVTLLKTNKTLALALQDARCELSAKQKLLENAANNFKNIVQARVLMVEMYSDLKSIMKKFDDTLPLLNVEDIKISDLIVPFRSCNEFKRKIKKIGESVEEVSEENSFSFAAEKVNCDLGVTESPNQTISCDHNSSVAFESMEVTNRCIDDGTKTSSESEHNLPVQVCIENASTFNSKNTVHANDPKPSVCENLKEAVNLPVEIQTSPTKNDAVKNRESSGTPRLSIPSIITINNSKVPSISKTCESFKKLSSHVKSTEEVFNTCVSSSKVKNSKIPRLHMSLATKMDSGLSDDSDKYPTTSQKTRSQNVLEDSDSTVRRKTFVVKNSDTSASSSQSKETLNENEKKNENEFTIGESGPVTRKTFFIKSQNIPEDTRKSISNRRKTFVKKSSNNTKTRKSVENRRDTFVIFDKEDCTKNVNVTSISEVSTFNDIVKEKCLLRSKRKISNELPQLPLVCDEIKEITEKEFKDNLVNQDISSSSKMIPLKTQFEQIQPQGKDTVTKTNKTILKQGECALENGNNSDVKGNLYKTENVNKEPSTCENVESSNICMTSQKFRQPVVSDEDIKILEANENTHYFRPKKRVSYKIISDSSDSDCEIIPDLDFQFLNEPPVKPVPIRKRISGSRKNKVFVFNAHKRKSVQHKKSLGKVRKSSLKHLDLMNNCNNVSQSNSTNIKNLDVIAELSKDKGEEKPEECISYDSNVNISNNKINNSDYREVPCKKQEVPQCAATGGEDTEIFKSVHNEKFNNQEFTMSKCDENVIKNSLSHFNSPVIALHNSLNVIECESEGSDSKEEKDNMIHNSETKSSKAGKKSEVKKDFLKDSSVDDISVKKRSKIKRNNSRKKSELIITSDEVEGSKNNVLLKNKNQGKESRKKIKAKSTMSKKKSTFGPNDNTIVVQAEVHSPPQQSFTVSETGCFNKENKGKTENENCFVILNDIFQPADVDMLSLSCKDKIVSKGRNVPLKAPLSDNSSNILNSVRDNHNVKDEGNIAINVQDIDLYARRRRRVNYSEPSLRKKLRQ